MKVYLKSDFEPQKVIIANSISFDNALHHFIVYGRDGTITFVDLDNTHFIFIRGN